MPRRLPPVQPPQDLHRQLDAGIAAPLRRRAGWDDEAGDVPVRRALAARQLFGVQLMAGPGTDQVEPQRLAEALADRTGIDGGLGRRRRNRSSTLH